MMKRLQHRTQLARKGLLMVMVSLAMPVFAFAAGNAIIAPGETTPVTTVIMPIEATSAGIGGLRPDSSTTRSDEAAPAKPFLEQNYPNPFNSTTTFRYGVPVGTKVMLTIHTLLGPRVKVLIDEWHSAGVYNFVYANNDLPPGMYFYRLQTSFGTITRRFTISE